MLRGIVIGIARLVGGDSALPRSHAGHGAAADRADVGGRRAERHSVAGQAARRGNRCSSSDGKCRRVKADDTDGLIGLEGNRITGKLRGGRDAAGTGLVILHDA